MSCCSGLLRKTFAPELFGVWFHPFRISFVQRSSHVYAVNARSKPPWDHLENRPRWFLFNSFVEDEVTNISFKIVHHWPNFYWLPCFRLYSVENLPDDKKRTINFLISRSLVPTHCLLMLYYRMKSSENKFCQCFHQSSSDILVCESLQAATMLALVFILPFW